MYMRVSRGQQTQQNKKRNRNKQYNNKHQTSEVTHFAEKKTRRTPKHYAIIVIK